MNDEATRLPQDAQADRHPDEQMTGVPTEQAIDAERTEAGLEAAENELRMHAERTPSSSEDSER